jgi:hypothetical protein
MYNTGKLISKTSVVHLSTLTPQGRIMLWEADSRLAGLEMIMDRRVVILEIIPTLLSLSQTWQQCEVVSRWSNVGWGKGGNQYRILKESKSEALRCGCQMKRRPWLCFVSTFNLFWWMIENLPVQFGCKRVNKLTKYQSICRKREEATEGQINIYNIDTGTPRFMRVRKMRFHFNALT